MLEVSNGERIVAVVMNFPCQIDPDQLNAIRIAWITAAQNTATVEDLIHLMQLRIIVLAVSITENSKWFFIWKYVNKGSTLFRSEFMFLFVFNWAGMKPRRSTNKGVRPRPFSCSKLCKTTPSENILSHYKPAAGGMNALWPKLSTSSERIFIKYILIDIKNGSKLFPWSEFFFHLKPLEDIFCHFTRENCKNFVRGTFYFYIHLEPLEEGGWSFWNINLPNSTLLM